VIGPSAGGGAEFPAQAQYVFDKIVAANKAGDYIPLWGTCMGFQWLLISASRDQSILDPQSGQMDAYNISLPLEFTDAAPASRLFSAASKEVYDILGTQSVTMNNHHYGIWTGTF
jgi:gamma-glutamyl hydrolase